jgi:hypothetical protein
MGFGGGRQLVPAAQPVPTKDDAEVLRKKKEETRMASNRVGLGRTANMLGQDIGTANTQRARLLGQA